MEWDGDEERAAEVMYEGILTSGRDETRMVAVMTRWWPTGDSLQSISARYDWSGFKSKYVERESN